jgi:hypothetical protein
MVQQFNVVQPSADGVWAERVLTSDGQVHLIEVAEVLENVPGAAHVALYRVRVDGYSPRTCSASTRDAAFGYGRAYLSG